MVYKPPVLFPDRVTRRTVWLRPGEESLESLPWDRDCEAWEPFHPRELKRSRSRWTFHLTLQERDLVVKRYLVDRFLRGWVARVWSSKGKRELEISRRLHDLGIPTPEPVACLELWAGWRLFASYLVTAHIPSALDVCAWLRASPERAADCEVFGGLGSLLGRLHACGLAHNDCSAYNFLVREAPQPGEERLLAIDLDGAKMRRRVNERRREYNFVQLLRSLRRHGIQLEGPASESLCTAYVEATEPVERDAAARAFVRARRASE